MVNDKIHPFVLYWFIFGTNIFLGLIGISFLDGIASYNAWMIPLACIPFLLLYVLILPINKTEIGSITRFFFHLSLVFQSVLIIYYATLVLNNFVYTIVPKEVLFWTFSLVPVLFIYGGIKEVIHTFFLFFLFIVGIIMISVFTSIEVLKLHLIKPIYFDLSYFKGGIFLLFIFFDLLIPFFIDKDLKKKVRKKGLFITGFSLLLGLSQTLFYLKALFGSFFSGKIYYGFSIFLAVAPFEYFGALSFLNIFLIPLCVIYRLGFNYANVMKKTGKSKYIHLGVYIISLFLTFLFNYPQNILGYLYLGSSILAFSLIMGGYINGKRKTNREN